MAARDRTAGAFTVSPDRRGRGRPGVGDDYTIPINARRIPRGSLTGTGARRCSGQRPEVSSPAGRVAPRHRALRRPMNTPFS